MATSLQSTRRKRLLRKPSLKYKSPTFSRTPILKKSPQAKGIVVEKVGSHLIDIQGALAVVNRQNIDSHLLALR